ncbi:cytochrome c biogenesis protein ResB [Blastococcus saxobsidens]|uniref:ResB-related putative cytochrome C-type biogenesis protein n=1 Tax=Blastococcus saxobsidens (strain DD2) TaxID=1146883 RepID=H6RPL4_BLASD|nr:cytochrome c biogenesis protein ResB [Blastococcus saxobsidens]CCG05273.1 ResB-related putative cytochrome C-type biogenesis protein [Blastococcus saxobsidens DD2]
MTTTAPPRAAAAPPPPRPPSAGRRLGGLLLRWWRRLTAMRTAIVLLFLLALAAVPGSLLPQRSLSQNNVNQYFTDHPDLAPVLDRLYLFDVFSSPWFAAVYLLLFVSLIGCVVPRAAEHARALRTPPPPAPRNMLRLPDSAELTVPVPPAAALDVVEEELRVRRFRVVRRDGGRGPELSAEKGYLKETGNLVFHLSLLALLLGLAGGKLWGYEGSILVTEGQGFCNSFQQYDTYSAGPLVDSGDLSPLCVDLEQFTAEYEENLTAASFTADIRYGAPSAEGRPTTIGVNDPLRLDGDRVYVTGHGFSPTFTVTVPDGTTFSDLTVPFLPSDPQTLASQGALKLPDIPGQDEQLAIEGFLAPTGLLQGGVLTSVDPRPLAPQVAVVAYQGYLGLDSGLPQSVYSLDGSQIERGRLSEVGSANLSVGESLELPDGTRITFSGVKEFAALQYSHDPGQLWVLAAAIALLAGLLGMLLLRRERVFARAEPGGERGGTVLTLASLTRGGGESGGRSTALLDDLQGALTTAAPARTASEPEVPPRD